MNPHAAAFRPLRLNIPMAGGIHRVEARSVGAPTSKHLDDNFGTRTIEHVVTIDRPIWDLFQDLITTLREENMKDMQRVPLANFFATLDLDLDLDERADINERHGSLSYLAW
jgi:hypothetical protein